MKVMKATSFTIILFFTVCNSVFSQTVKDSLGDGLYRVQFTNIYNCKSELQSFNKDFKEEDLQKSLSLLTKIGGKDRGLNVEFPYYSVFSGLTEKKQQIANGEKHIQAFQESLKKLKDYQVTAPALALKDSLVKFYTSKLEFEKTFLDWVKSGDDATFKKKILAMYNDIYMVNTLDKVLAIKDWNDKFKYTYSEVGAILESKLFIFENIIKAQTYLFANNGLKIAIDPKCVK